MDQPATQLTTVAKRGAFDTQWYNPGNCDYICPNGTLAARQNMLRCLCWREDTEALPSSWCANGLSIQNFCEGGVNNLRILSSLLLDFGFISQGTSAVFSCLGGFWRIGTSNATVAALTGTLFAGTPCAKESF